MPLFLDDNPRVTVMEIRAKARRMKARMGGLALIVIDYLQLMSGGASAENRQLEVSEISRGLKILARELEVADHRPQPAQPKPRDPRRQAPDARRPARDRARSSRTPTSSCSCTATRCTTRSRPTRRSAEVIIAKHRSGPTGTVRLVFRGQYTKFDNAARGV